MNPKLKGYLQLCRPANLPTAAADIFAGITLSGLFSNMAFEYTNLGSLDILLLVSASMLLYAGGVVLNDVFDADLDKIERPERPIPSGLILLKNARFFGFLLLIIGIILSVWVNVLSGWIAVALAASIVLYDAISKKNPVLGPLNMGLCRGLNLLLGMSLLKELFNWYYAFIPIVFIAAVTTISRGEVHGNNRKNLIVAALLYVLAATLLIYFNYLGGIVAYEYLLFLGVFLVMVGMPLYKAYQENTPQNIKKAVIAGVMSLVVLDAAISVGYSSWYYGVLILLLLPLSILLSKVFAVT